MSDAKKRVEQIIEHLSKDVELSESLIHLINKQYSAISLVDSEGLNSVNQEIESITSDLKSHTDIRSENLRFLGFEPSEKGLQKLAEKLPTKMQNKVIGLKNNLESNIIICKKANEKSANQLILSRELLAKITGNAEQDYLE